MTKTILRLISSGTLIVVTALLLLAANYLTPLFFSFYPDFSRWIVGILAGITSVVPFALCEILLALLVLWFLVSLIRAIVRRRMVRWLTGMLLSVCTLVAAFVAIWGLNYYAPPMAERLGLPERQYTPAELKEAATYYRDRANELASGVERDETGVMVEYDFDTLAAHAGDGYRTLAQSYECFDGSTVRVKRLLSSKLMGMAGTTGVFICLTGESAVSTTTFRASMPFTMAHEIGHRMAFAREDEANFAAFLACDASERPEFRYSGYYQAYIYCYNALYQVDPAAAQEVREGCSELLLNDLYAATAHYDEVEDETVSEIQDKVYDGYLQAFSVESGIQSYGEVADLLLTWYFEGVR